MLKKKKFHLHLNNFKKLVQTNKNKLFLELFNFQINLKDSNFYRLLNISFPKLIESLKHYNQIKLDKQNSFFFKVYNFQKYNHYKLYFNKQILLIIIIYS